MLFPAGASPVSDNGWGVVITYEEDGYVSDKDADSINYDSLIKEMKEGTAESNKEREKQGYQTVDLVGWAAKPYYDKDAHKLYWAKELAFGGNAEHTLNYNIRVLGRRGVLVLNAVAGMDQLASVEKDMRNVLAFTDFNPGYRYADFDSKTDKTATYGIAALVAGGLAAKGRTVHEVVRRSSGGEETGDRGSCRHWSIHRQSAQTEKDRGFQLSAEKKLPP